MTPNAILAYTYHATQQKSYKKIRYGMTSNAVLAYTYHAIHHFSREKHENLNEHIEKQGLRINIYTEIYSFSQHVNYIIEILISTMDIYIYCLRPASTALGHPNATCYGFSTPKTLLNCIKDA